MKDTSWFEHPPEATLERYILHQCSESELARIETHFLACEGCITRLEQLELRISATKLALQELHLEKVARSSAKHRKRNTWFSVPKLSIAGGIAMVAVALSVLPGIHRGIQPAINVQLTAYRGVESRALPKDRALHLGLKANGLTGSFAKVTLVDGNGVEIWTDAAVPIRNNLVTVDVPQVHSTGNHFFRLYQPGQVNAQVSEFSVIIQ